MQIQQDFGAIAREIIDSNLYMVLGTADETGQPWVSPVYFAPQGYQEFYWVSSPEVRHSRNIAARPQVSIVVFNSQAPIGTGQAVYMSATAQELAEEELDQGIAVFSASSIRHGGREWKREKVQSPTLYRLYRAIATEHWVVAPESHPDHRMPVSP